MSDDKIISIRLEEEYPIQRRRKSACACSHISDKFESSGQTPPVLIDEATRMVECRKCGALMDPYDFLWHLANNGSHLNAEMHSLKETIRSLKAVVSVLEDEIKTLKSEKSRIKRIA